MKTRVFISAIVGVASLALAGQVSAACPDVSYEKLLASAKKIVPSTGKPSGGLGFPMWVTMVDETGRVCNVVNSNGGGDNSNAAWLGSRVISAQKANTANAFSHDGLPLSTANLYGTVQVGGSLYGLQHSNPVDATIAYNGSSNAYGTKHDPLRGKRIGGINVFGGGLALYSDKHVKIGALGVSGDTSCTDHIVAWKIRADLGLDHIPGGVTNDTDAMNVVGVGLDGGFTHPNCGNPDDVDDAATSNEAGADAISGN